MGGNNRARRTRDVSFSLRLASALVLILALAGTSGAATFTVTSTADAVDANPGNGVCATSGGVCTLRAAIQEANTAAGGPHTVAIPAGTYTLTITGQGENAAATGDLDISANMTIIGAGAGSTIIQAGTNSTNGIDRVIDIPGNTTCSISGVTIRFGDAGSGAGGGMNVVKGIATLTDVVLSGNKANIGGGIYNEGSSGPLTLNNVTISGNSALSDGGGVYDKKGSVMLTNVTIDGNMAARDGGGIYSEGTVGMTISDSTISVNSGGGEGGGLYMKGNTGVLTNVTMSANSASGGGGIVNYKVLTLTNVTMSGNSASSAGGNILNKSTGSTTLRNTIVTNSPSGGNCSGNVTSQGYNLDSANTCGLNQTGDKINTNPLLGPLANNGGYTQTHALLAGSPAIDNGTNTGAPATDQRGVSRPIDGDGDGTAIADMGAYEYQFVPVRRPDAMIKLASDGAGGYLTDNLYETSATVQSKSQGVVSGTTANYNLRFQNDGNTADNLVVTGTGNGAGFTVQYLDNTSVDRTVAAIGSGYTIAGLAAGASSVWTLRITPSGNPVPVGGGTSYTVFVTVTSATDNTKIDQVKAVTTSTSANLTLVKSADKATAVPGEEIAFTVNASNGSGLSAADNVVLNEAIPADTGFKVGGATFNAGTSTLSLQSIGYFVTGPGWSYTPASEACSAPPGYDYCVEQVRWMMTGTMPTGTGFSVGLVVRVK